MGLLGLAVLISVIAAAALLTQSLVFIPLSLLGWLKLPGSLGLLVLLLLLAWGLGD